MSSAHFEVRKLSIEDMGLSPKVFFTERDGYAVMGKAAHYAQFRAAGIDTPVYYFRNITPEGQRWAGISCFGATPLTPQTGLHGDDLAQGETPSTRYRKVCDNPKTYEIETQEPYSRIRYIDDGQGGVILECREGKDGCILDIRAVPFPVAVISHANQDQPAPYFQVNTVVTGTYMGRPIRGMGGFDRTFVVNHKTAGTAKIEADYAATYRCCCALYSGIREDGRKECVYALITNQNGKGIGMYYLDGAPTFVSENVRLDAKFCHLPYVDDGTWSIRWQPGPLARRSFTLTVNGAPRALLPTQSWKSTDRASALAAGTPGTRPTPMWSAIPLTKTVGTPTRIGCEAWALK